MKIMWFTAVMPPGDGVGVGVAVGVGVGVGDGVGVGVGVGDAETVMLSEEEKKKPVVSHARITMACFPAGREMIALSDALVLLAFCTESMYMIIAVMVCALSRAAAENVTGEPTVAPFSGEHMFTVLSTVAVQATEARPVRKREAARSKTEEVRGRKGTTGPPNPVFRITYQEDPEAVAKIKDQT